MKIASISIIIVAVVVAGMIMLVGKKSNTDSPANLNNVSVVEGKQIIQITARGGYQPRRSVAKAGIPSVVRFDTRGTFDCSSSVRIPSLGIAKNLPQTGSTDIDIGTPQAGLLRGSCGMGMYPFEIDFTN